MNALTHTLDLDPAVAWRLVGTPKSIALHPEPPAIARAADIGTAGERAITAPNAERDPRRPQIGDVVELGCFVAALAGIWLMQLGVFALLV
jgi:hypothetical protein